MQEYYYIKNIITKKQIQLSKYLNDKNGKKIIDDNNKIFKFLQFKIDFVYLYIKNVFCFIFIKKSLKKGKKVFN